MYFEGPSALSSGGARIDRVPIKSHGELRSSLLPSPL